MSCEFQGITGCFKTWPWNAAVFRSFALGFEDSKKISIKRITFILVVEILFHAQQLNHLKAVSYCNSIAV